MDSVGPTAADSEATASTVAAASGEIRPPHRNRFSALGEAEAELAQSIEGPDAEDRPRKRLVLVSQHSDDRRGHDREWDSDTDTVGGTSDVEVTDVVAPTVEEAPVPMDVRVWAPVRAFTSLDAINLTHLFEHGARLMQSVPHVIRGAFRMALRVACQEILDGMEANSEVRTVRGWKLLLLLPRMMLFRPNRGGPVSRKKLESRVRQFQEGDWISLLRESVACAEAAHISSVRRRRRSADEEAVRAARALSLVRMGELSAGRQAFKGASLAPGNLATLGILTDPPEDRQCQEVL